jgi:hypothetical protein
MELLLAGRNEETTEIGLPMGNRSPSYVRMGTRNIKYLLPSPPSARRLQENFSRVCRFLPAPGD